MNRIEELLGSTSNTGVRIWIIQPEDNGKIYEEILRRDIPPYLWLTDSAYTSTALNLAGVTGVKPVNIRKSVQTGQIIVRKPIRVHSYDDCDYCFVVKGNPDE